MKGRSLRLCLWEGNEVPKKIDILGVKVDPVTMEEAVALLATKAEKKPKAAPKKAAAAKKTATKKTAAKKTTKAKKE